jgi:hypothetical protein
MVVTGAGQSDARADGASERWTTQLAGLFLLAAATAGLLGQGAYYPSVQRPVGLLIAVAALLALIGQPLSRDDLRLLPVIPGWPWPHGRSWTAAWWASSAPVSARRCYWSGSSPCCWSAVASARTIGRSCWPE